MKKIILIIAALLAVYFSATLNAETLKLTHPNGGDRFRVGSDSIITWEGVDATDTVTLEYSIDAGATWEILTTKATGLQWTWKNIPQPVSDECLVKVSSKASTPYIEWQKYLGPRLTEFNSVFRATSDGGYIWIFTKPANSGEVLNRHDSDEIWIVKMASNGAVEWNTTLGGSSKDEIESFCETKDNGYIILGRTYSNDGDISGNHGNSDIWIAKLDLHGAIEWQKCYGGSNSETPILIKETIDSGFIILGTTMSNDGDVSGLHGSKWWDAWVLKITNTGILQWQKCLGGTNAEYPVSIYQTQDSGYILASEIFSNDGDVVGYHGIDQPRTYEIWIVKLSSIGKIQWQKCLGGSSDDYMSSLLPTIDGGYIIVGSTYSIDGDVEGLHGGSDAWLVKLTSTGEIDWKKCYGGGSTDVLGSIRMTQDGGYILCGLTYSSDGDINGLHGDDDAWILRLTNSGTIKWSKCFGGTLSDNAIHISSTRDGGYLVAADSYSIDGDVIGSHGKGDAFLFKLNDDGNLLWQKCIGDSIYYSANVIFETSDSGCIAEGASINLNGGNDMNDGCWAVKLSKPNAVQEDLSDSFFAIVLPALELSTAHIDFDSVIVGTYKDSIVETIVTNWSDGAIKIGQISFSGAHPTDFSLSNGAKDTSFIVPPLTFANMSFRFQPTDTGERTCNIGFFYEGQVSALSAKLTGVGYRKAHILSTNPMPQYLLCDNVSVDAITISNIGNQVLRMSSVSIIGANRNDFSVDNSYYSVLPDSSIKIAYRFIPNSVGEKNAQIQIKSNADPDSLLLISISGKKDSANIISLIDLIDLGTIFTNSQKDTSFAIKNVGSVINKAFINAPAHILSDKSSPLLFPDSLADLKITFTGTSTTGDFSEDIIIYDSICHRERKITVIAHIIDFPSVILSSGSASAKTGDTITIPIFLKNKINLVYSSLTSIKSDLSFNSTLLVPVYSAGDIIGDTRTIPLDLAYNGNDTLTKIKFIVCLGSDTVANLVLSDYKVVGDTVNLRVENGVFNLLGTCQEGGTRLINPNGKTKLLAINPNPSSDILEIGYSLREDSFTEIYIINSQGTRVMDITSQKMSSGDYTTSANIQELSTGVYTLVLRTNADIVTERFVISK